MSGVEEVLKQDFPEATAAECKRFVKACQDGKKDADKVKEDAEKLLEDYLDWRSCFGLDYKESVITIDDAADWKYAVNKALEVKKSMERAEVLGKMLAEEAKVADVEEKPKVSYDIEFSDSQKEENNPTESVDGSEQGKGGGDKKDGAEENKKDVDNDHSDDEFKRNLPQMIYLHTTKDGNPVADKEGRRILHVLPGLIHRKQVGAEFYSLALSFYLDRKFDRDSDEKMTVLLDVRAGDGWPNPVAFMMINFVRHVTKMLQGNYPERLGSMLIFPVPTAAMYVFAAIKSVFKYGILDKIVLFPGPADRNSPLPKEMLEKYVDGEVLDITEQVRLDNFKPIGSYSDES